MHHMFSDIAAVAALALTPALWSVLILILAAISLSRRWFSLVSKSLAGLSLACASLWLAAHVLDRSSGYPVASLENTLVAAFVMWSILLLASTWLLRKLNFRLQHNRGQ